MSLKQRLPYEVTMSTSQKKLYFSVFHCQIKCEPFHTLAMCRSQKAPGGSLNVKTIGVSYHVFSGHWLTRVQTIGVDLVTSLRNENAKESYRNRAADPPSVHCVDTCQCPMIPGM